MAVGRELKMKELKKEIANLNAELLRYRQDSNAGKRDITQNA
jgi:ribosomal protein L29